MLKSENKAKRASVANKIMGTMQGSLPHTRVETNPETVVVAGRVAARPLLARRRFAIALLAAVFLAAFVVWLRPLWVFDRVTQARLALVGMRHEEVTLDGYHIHYLVGGQGSPVVLVHGLGSRATDWADLIPPIVRKWSPGVCD